MRSGVKKVGTYVKTRGEEEELSPERAGDLLGSVFALFSAVLLLLLLLLLLLSLS